MFYQLKLELFFIKAIGKKKGKGFLLGFPEVLHQLVLEYSIIIFGIWFKILNYWNNDFKSL